MSEETATLELNGHTVEVALVEDGMGGVVLQIEGANGTYVNGSARAVQLDVASGMTY